MTRKRYADYLQCTIEDEHAKWVSDHIVKDRRICLYGIAIGLNTGKKGQVEMSPCIPALSPLMKLVNAHPKAEQFRWNKKTKKWQLA